MLDDKKNLKPMRTDRENIEQIYRSIQEKCTELANKIEALLIDYFNEVQNIDKISCRLKGESSFLTKTEKINDDGQLKYPAPFREIQDIIGARIVVYYKSDSEIVKEKIRSHFLFVEEQQLVPDDVSKFGYEGIHFICHIPSFIERDKTNHDLPYFFELQVKTLYQHAWAQSQHGLGYKPGSTLTKERERMMAFLAAQSWGADEILMQLIS